MLDGTTVKDIDQSIDYLSIVLPIAGAAFGFVGGFLISSATSIGTGIADLAIDTVTGIATQLIAATIDLGYDFTAGLVGGIVTGSIDFVSDLTIGGTGLGIIEDFLGGLGSAGASIVDTVTLDFFDFDQSGGALPGSAAGEAVGAQGAGNPAATTETQKAIMAWILAHLGKTFKIKLPSGKEKVYTIQSVKSTKRGGSRTDSNQNQAIKVLQAKLDAYLAARR